MAIDTAGCYPTVRGRVTVRPWAPTIRSPASAAAPDGPVRHSPGKNSSTSSTRRVRAVAGFSWGFTINGQTITIAAPKVLGRRHGTVTSACCGTSTLNGPSTPGTRRPERSCTLTQRNRSGRTTLAAGRRAAAPFEALSCAHRVERARWAKDAKKPETRADHVVKTVASLRGGKRSG